MIQSKDLMVFLNQRASSPGAVWLLSHLNSARLGCVLFRHQVLPHMKVWLESLLSQGHCLSA